MFYMDESNGFSAKLKVVGIGGGGCNAINNMVEAGLQGVEFIAVNTYIQSLATNRAGVKIQIGTKLTRGLGAGANPEVGRQAAGGGERQARDAWGTPLPSSGIAGWLVEAGRTERARAGSGRLAPAG